MFWGAIRPDGRKMLVRCPNKLNAVGYVEILKKLRKNAFSGHYFSTSSCYSAKTEDYRHFFSKRSKVLKWPAKSPDLNPIENLWAILMQRLQKQSFWQNLEKGKFENEIDADVVRNLYENYSNRLLDVRKAAMTPYSRKTLNS